MIKVGVIGCGTIANAAHIPSYMKNADVEIKYFCDIIPERAQAAVEKYGCGIAVTNYHDVINDPEIDAISVCTPNRMHPVITIDALRAGKNVLCEKPAARTYAEAEQMVQAQRETGKILVIGVVNRFNDSVRQDQAVSSTRGALGDGAPCIRQLPPASQHSGAGRRLYHQGNRRRRRADRLGRALSGYRRCTAAAIPRPSP